MKWGVHWEVIVLLYNFLQSIPLWSSCEGLLPEVPGKASKCISLMPFDVNSIRRKETTELAIWTKSPLPSPKGVNCTKKKKKGQSYEDKRCRCICPSPAAVLNSTLSPNRKQFTYNVAPNKCDCDNVILPHIGDEIKGHEQEYCLRCQCKYESRNTAIIKVVVVMIVWLITLLFIYMGFLMCLDPLIHRQKVKYYPNFSSDEVQNLLIVNEEED